MYLGSGYHLSRASFESEEGFQQGGVVSAPGFCIGISPELKALDAELQAAGGAARAGMDDAYAVGPPGVVFPAVQRFKTALQRELGLELREDKSAYCIDPLGQLMYHQAHPEGPTLAALAGGIPQGFLVDTCGAVHYGVKVYGVPIGNEKYVRAFLDEKCSEVLGTYQHISNLLSCRRSDRCRDTVNCSGCEGEAGKPRLRCMARVGPGLVQRFVDGRR